MERLPATAFGRTLRLLIREVWGTQSRFAEEIHLDTTWITKVIRGDQESLTYASLEKIMEGFALPEEQERLYASWLESYAPSPVARGDIDPWSSDEDLLAYASSVHNRISAGKVLSTHRTLGIVWQSLEKLPRRLPVKMAIGHAYVDTANQLERIPASLKVCQTLVDMAIRSGEPPLIANTLWIQGVSFRLARPQIIRQADAKLISLADYLVHWEPASIDELKVKSTFEQICARDLVLSGLDAVKSNLASKEFLQARVARLEKNLDQIENLNELGLAHEVLARAFTSMGELGKASKSLHFASQHVHTQANRLKVLIGNVQLLHADRQEHKAQEILEEAIDFADEFSLVHHRQKLSKLQSVIEASGAAPR